MPLRGGRRSRGMDYRFDEHLIVSEDELIKYVERNYLITEVISLDNNKSIISLNKNIETDENKLYDDSKNNNDFNLFYFDTDSIYIDKKLKNKYVGKDLGQLKLENIFKEASFLAPKAATRRGAKRR